MRPKIFEDASERLSAQVSGSAERFMARSSHAGEEEQGRRVPRSGRPTIGATSRAVSSAETGRRAAAAPWFDINQNHVVTAGPHLPTSKIPNS